MFLYNFHVNASLVLKYDEKRGFNSRRFKIGYNNALVEFVHRVSKPYL